MKRLILSLLLSVTILPFNRVYGEVILLDNKMTEAEAIHTPYTLTTSMIGIGKLGNAKLAFKLNAITLEDFAEIPGSKICGIPGNNTVSEPKIPQIPAINYNLELPSQENCSIIISNAEYVEIPVVLAPGVEAEAGVNGGDIIEAITPYTGFFPENPIAQISLQNYKGLSIHGFSITPVLYDYENQKIRVYKSFDATITYVEGEKDTESGRSDIFKAQREIEKIGFTPNPVDNILGIGLKEYPREKTQDYLLIADNWNGDDLKEFIEWKKTLCFRVHFYNMVPGNPNVNKWTWEQLREFINQQYTELDNLTYVLIWGHPNNLPGIPFSEFESGKNKRDTATYTGYALENWDSTFPRFYVGRIHSQIPAQALEAVKKIIDYEKTPVTDPFFYSNAFLAGQFEGKGTNSLDNGVSPNLLTKENCETEDLG